MQEERPIKADASGHTVFSPELSAEIMFFEDAFIKIVSKTLKEDGYTKNGEHSI